MRFCLGTVKAPVFQRVHFRVLSHKAVCQLDRNLLTVGVANHVVVKDHAAHPREVDTTCLKRTAAPFEEGLAPGKKFFLDFV